MSDKGLNLPAVIVVGEKFLFRIEAERTDSIDAVYDGGLPLVIDGDDPDLETLRKAHILPGHVRTCKAAGSFRIGWPNVFPLTVDATGSGLPPPYLLRPEDIAGAVSDERRAELSRLGLLFRDERRIADRLRSAVSELNRAYAEAVDAGLFIDLHYVNSQKIGAPYPARIYSAQIERREVVE